ncbi:MAG: prolipoprotein diacylglyceryl transferase [Clostridium sp.]|nr:MAG: prolipoprotein diacylglyceryl transferase [Clostridium sp.]
MNSLNPVAFKLFGLEVRWYAICILIGVIIAVIMGVKEGKKLGIFSDYVYTGICIVLPLAIMGARLWYVLFNLDEFDSLLDVLGITSNGLAGLAIQGGVIASLITIYFFMLKKEMLVFIPH